MEHDGSGGVHSQLMKISNSFLTLMVAALVLTIITSNPCLAFISKSKADFVLVVIQHFQISLLHSLAFFSLRFQTHLSNNSIDYVLFSVCRKQSFPQFKPSRSTFLSCGTINKDIETVCTHSVSMCLVDLHRKLNPACSQNTELP